MPPSSLLSTVLKTFTTLSAWDMGSREANSNNSARCIEFASLKAWSGCSCSAGTAPSEPLLSSNHLCRKHSVMDGRSESENVSMLQQSFFPCLCVLISSHLGPRLCSASQSLGLKLLARNGISPAKSWYSTQPRDHTSHLGPKLPIQTSGAMVVGVPPIILPWGSASGKSSATPRSMMTTKGSSKLLSFFFTSMMFSSLRSLWMTRLPWQ
mmetsp:Transcript_57465/g.153928  ORF Transcript_57465/g.153928 Transcript_57465/m.153928 type:complete len:210 (+) Transcript_57465:530-1159(+)